MQRLSRLNRLRLPISQLALLILLLLGSTRSIVWGQNTTGTLTGTVTDSSGAVVPGASIVLKNESSGDIRRTLSNGDGFFSIAAVQPGSYSATVESKGFNSWEQKGIVFNAG